MLPYPKTTPDFLYDGLSTVAREAMQDTATTSQRMRSRNYWSILFDMRSLFKSFSKTKILLAAIWIWLLSWGERESFETHVSKCSWENWEKWDSPANPHHLILLADPQLIDPHTYPGRPWPLSAITMKHTDQYMRRSFEALDRILDPSTVFFLGDLFDGGREWSTGASKSPDSRWHKYGRAYWLWEYDRFGKIYHEPWMRNSRTSQHHDRRLISTLPGNHDLGLGHGIRLPVRERFQTYFGYGNRVDSIANHTFVSVDSVSLSAKLELEGDHGARPNPAIWEPTEQFLANIQDHKHRVSSRSRHLQLRRPENALQNHTAVDLEYTPSESQWLVPEDAVIPETPTIILSHVPFWRDPDTPCGPQRERHPPAAGEAYDPNGKDSRNAIAVAYGYQYQNVLVKELSSYVVKSVGNVKHIFSGDDHDYCKVLHKDLDPNQPSIPEITVKSTSWAMGVRKPASLLVSLWNPLDGAVAPAQTIQTHLCFQPDQLGIFIRYLQLILCTLTALAVRSFVFRRSLLKKHGKEAALLPMPVTTPTYSKPDFDSGSYSSSNSNSKNGLAARSNAGRGQSLGQSNDYGLSRPLTPATPSNGGYLSPARTHSPIHISLNDERWEASPISTRRTRSGILGRPIVRDFFTSILHITSIALLWYWWLARTV